MMSVSDWANRHGADEPIEGEVEQPEEQRVIPPLRPRAEFFRRRPEPEPAEPPLRSWFKEQQAVHAAQAAQRGKAAKDRAIGCAIWFALSFVLPGFLKYLAWWIAVGMGVAAMWNAEHWLMSRRQADVQLRDVLPDD